MTYLRELRDNWRPLLAAFVGLATGFSLAGTVTSAVAPTMIRDNGWTPAGFAAVGGLSIFTAAALPVVGRLTDVLGVRRTALIGLVALPLVYLAYSRMDGSLTMYAAIHLFQAAVCITTTATVYSRLAVQFTARARGLALAIVASGPAVSTAVLGPLFNEYIEDHGWRASYQALTMFAAIAGVLTFLLIPPQATEHERAAPRRPAREDYPEIFRSRAFWLLAAAMLLCNLPQSIMLTQLKVMLVDNGMGGREAGAAFTALSLGMLAGRFVAGAALDRFDPFIVSFVTLAFPSIGLFALASSLDAAALLIGAVFCLGLAFGGEADVIAYLVARCFGVRIYSSVLGLLTAIIASSAAIGATLLGLTLAMTGHFALFLTVGGVAVIAGAVLLLVLRRSAAEASAIEPDGLAPEIA